MEMRNAGFLCFFFLAASFSASAQSEQVRRVVLLSTHKRDESLLTEEAWLQSDRKGLAERDLAVTVITREDDPLAYRRLKPVGAFTFILFGKDGGEKYRSGRPVSLKTLYSIVDAMPMRQEEMRKSKSREFRL